jgi:dGTPase
MAYATHDAEDAGRAGIVDPDDLPKVVVDRAGSSRSRQLNAFITDVVVTSQHNSAIGMSTDMAEALAALRAWDYERIYLRPESVKQSRVVHRMLRALVEHYATHPTDLPGEPRSESDEEVVRAAVTYVAGMTDRFACAQAERLIGWPRSEMPDGFDVPTSR